MTVSNNLEVDEEQAYYDKSVEAGQKVIRESWRQLTSATQKLFFASGRWSERGQIQKQASEREWGAGEWDADDKVKRLEVTLGTLSRCAAAQIPYARNDPKAIVPREAFSDDVLHECIELAADPTWHEPLFLRLALRAICQHEMANLLTRLPVVENQKDPPFAALWAFFKVAGILMVGATSLVLYLASPLLLGIALVQANKGELGAAAIALYGLGLLWWLHSYSKSKSNGDNLSTDEKTYRAWSSLCQWPFQTHAIGEGALAHLEKMKRDGFDVPHIAFDVCAALRATILRQAA